MPPRVRLRTTTVRLREDQIDALHRVADDRAKAKGIFKLDHSEVIRELLDEGLKDWGLLK